MSVTIQDVLALVADLFPGVQPVFLSRIRPYPDNPGPPITEEEIADLREAILEDGLVNPAKLRPDPVNPLAPGVSLHPDNPRLKADGTPWKVEDFNWMILAGERRWRAFNKLQGEGWFWLGSPSPGHKATYRLTHLELPHEGAIPSFILSPTEEEAVIITHTDNDIRQRGWFAGYQSIEALIKANPNQSQRQVAAKLKMDLPNVNWAIQLLPLLNTEARGLIVRIPNNSNKGKMNISESAASHLADLGPGTGFKPGVRKKEPTEGETPQKLWPYPPIPPETQDLIRQTLAMAIEHKMTEAKVKAYVAWIKEGHQPEDYRPKEDKGQAAQAQPAPSKAGGILSAGLTGLATLATKASAKLGGSMAGGKGKRKGSKGTSNPLRRAIGWLFKPLQGLRPFLSAMFGKVRPSLGQIVVWTILLGLVGIGYRHFHSHF